MARFARRRLATPSFVWRILSRQIIGICGPRDTWNVLSERPSAKLRWSARPDPSRLTLDPQPAPTKLETRTRSHGPGEGFPLKTIYDVVTMVLFAGLAILFLQRSTEPENPRDKILYYVPAGAGCALANWLGNQHMDLPAIGVILAVVVYTYFVLKPFTQKL